MNANTQGKNQQLPRSIDIRVQKMVNPIILKIAGTRFRSLSILKHVGRRSDREFVTPVTAFPLGDGFVLALLYGDLTTVDWCRNVMAAGKCTLKTLGQEFMLERPEIIPASDALRAYPPFWRYLLRAEGIKQFLWLHRHDESGEDVMSEAKIVISADGTRVGYIDEGSGMPIVIVHGGSSDVSHWERVARALSGTFRVIRIERRLYARNRQAKSPHTIQREVEDLAALFARIGEPVLLLGHSSGGVVALETALQCPSAVAGLVLYEPPVAVDRPLGGEALVRAKQALARGNTSQALTIHLRDIVRFPRILVLLMRLLPAWKELCALTPAQIADTEAIEALGVGVQRYARLEMPTLLFGGTRSPAHLGERLEALARVIPHAQTTLLRGQGHLANLRAPEQVARLVREFAEAVLLATPSLS